MSDETAKQFEQETPAPAPPTGRSVTLTVTLQPNGQVDFQLPSHKLVAYGMLELARAQLDKLAFMQEMQQAKAARGGMEGFLKRMNGG